MHGLDLGQLGAVLGVQAGQVAHQHLHLRFEVGYPVGLPEGQEFGGLVAQLGPGLIQLGAVVGEGLCRVLPADGATALDEGLGYLIGKGGGGPGIVPGDLDVEDAGVLAKCHVDGAGQGTRQGLDAGTVDHLLQGGGQFEGVEQGLEVVLLRLVGLAVTQGELVLMGAHDECHPRRPLMLHEGEGDGQGAQHDDQGDADY